MVDEPQRADTDTTDWTFVVSEGCAQCGYEPHDLAETEGRLTQISARWVEVLERSDVLDRPQPGTWSPVEYGAHSRDLLRLLRERVSLMLTEELPTFPDYDGEEEAVRGRFWESDPAELANDISNRAAQVRAVFHTLAKTDWHREGRRGDGRIFTVADMTRYLIHDLEHHLVDVGA